MANENNELLDLKSNKKNLVVSGDRDAYEQHRLINHIYIESSGKI